MTISTSRKARALRVAVLCWATCPGLARAQTAPAPKGDVAADRAVEPALAPPAAPVAKPEAVAAPAAGGVEGELQALRKELEAQKARLDVAEAQAAEAKALADGLAEAATPATEDEKLRIYGFTDMSVRRMYLHGDKNRFDGILPAQTSFYLGNVNLYFDAQPVEHFRALTEIRYTLYPWGSNPKSGGDAQDTTVLDIASTTGRNKVQWSGIVLERAQLEWKRYDLFKVTAGYFLTPYGIWNVDHGSPVLISSVLPEFFVGEYFPTHSLGLQFSGDTQAGSVDYGYRAYVTNGRSPAQYDLDKAKDFGGRVYAKFNGDVELTLGTSGFWGTYLDKRTVVDSTTPFRAHFEEHVAYQEFGLGGDVALDAGPFRVRAEIAMNHEEYEEGKRASAATVNGFPVPAFTRDRTRMSTYGLVAYQFPFGLEPYMYAEYTQRPGAEDDSDVILGPGFNVIFNAASRLKFQYFEVMFPNSDAFPSASEGNFYAWDLRWVLAF